jgi:hypothetical protein
VPVVFGLLRYVIAALRGGETLGAAGSHGLFTLRAPQISGPCSHKNLSSSCPFRSSGRLRRFTRPMPGPLGRNPHSRRISTHVSTSRACLRPAALATKKSSGFPAAIPRRFSSLSIRLMAVLIASTGNAYKGVDRDHFLFPCGAACSSAASRTSISSTSIPLIPQLNTASAALSRTAAGTFTSVISFSIVIAAAPMPC